VRALRLRLPLAVLALFLASAAPAGASSAQESIFQDDLQLLYSGPERRDATLDQIRGLGADTIRAFVFWNSVAPESSSTQRPPDFAAADPAAYPFDLWDRYDGLVRAATSRGMRVILTPTSPVPAWASQCRGSLITRQTCNPDPAQFGAFVRALGVRYSGGYADENDGGAVLPRVSRWGLWNEPNVGRWLTPQFVRRGGRLVPASPARYRALAAAAVAGLRASGHARDLILLGETAPIGNTTGAIVRRPVATATFWRNLLCVSRSGGPLRGRDAREQGCTRPPRLAVTGIAHHPYVRGGSRPPLTPPRVDEITIANPNRLRAILAQGAAQGRIGRGLGLWYTEFGFQTNPPDRNLGVSLARQASYLNQSDWIAFQDRGVQGIAQYLLRDDPTTAGFQSGLEFTDGRGKPALQAYRFPIHVVRRGVRVTVFGQVRQAPDGARGVVRVQVRLPGHEFTTYRSLTPNAKGFVLVRNLLSRRGTWRLYWEPEGGRPEISRTAKEEPR
jgi:hypothetical protein